MSPELHNPFAHHPAGIHPFSPNPDHDYEIRTALGHATRGAGEVGEILAATARIGKSDHEGWHAAWLGIAERAAGIAAQAASAGHGVSAAGAYLRAAAYYAVAVNAVSALADASALAPTFAKQRAAWDGFVTHTTVDVEAVQIPYEGEAVRAYTVADVAAQITTPLLILSPEGEQFWPGQSDQLAALTSDVSTVVAFTAAEGADKHCQPLARTLTAQRMFDWLDERLGR